MKKFASVLALLMVLSLSLSPLLVSHAEVIEDSWMTMADMPTARSGLGVAVVNGKIYAIGGMNGGHLNTNEEYDPATNTWATKKPMPIQRHRFAIAVVEHKIYVIGGEIPGNYYQETKFMIRQRTLGKPRLQSPPPEQTYVPVSLTAKSM